MAFDTSSSRASRFFALFASLSDRDARKARKVVAEMPKESREFFYYRAA